VRSAVQVVTNVGVPVGGIEPQASVEWKGMIELVDPLAGVVDGRRDVRSYRGRRRDPRLAASPRQRERCCVGTAPSRNPAWTFGLFTLAVLALKVFRS